MTPPSWREIILKGHRTFPEVPWRAPSRWRAKPSTLAVLVVGLSLFGFGEGLLFLAGIGNSPWTVLAEGVSIQLDWQIGVSTLVISVCVFALWLPLKEKPGIGTIGNILIIATVLGLVVEYLPPVSGLALQVLTAFAGVFLVGLASALYITTGLGPGPRDGLMTAIHHRTGIRVSRVRLMLEVSVFLLGWILGGTVGVGTVIFAGLVGRAIAFWLGVLARLVHGRVLPESDTN